MNREGGRRSAHSLRSILCILRRIRPNGENQTSLHHLDITITIRDAIDETGVRFVVAFDVETGIGVETRGDGADDGEEEGRSSADGGGGVL